jgi:hypothetical protein
VVQDVKPGFSTLWEDFQKKRGESKTEDIVHALRSGSESAGMAPGIGTPDDLRDHIREFEEVGVDQIIFLQQAGRNPHAEICESLELFGERVLPGFKAEVEAREARKAEALAPYIEAALKRKQYMKPLSYEEVPIVEASVKKAQVAE